MKYTFFNSDDEEYRKGTKRNYKMLEAMVSEQKEYQIEGRGTRSESGCEKIDEVIGFARTMGMKKLNKIEEFDKINIPVFSVEHEEKYENIISYNSGKGITDEQAKMSAIMEFIERKSSILHSPTSINFRYCDIEKENLIEPASLSTHYTHFVANSLNLNWFPVVRIIDGKNYLCPTIAVLFDYYDETALFLNNTNGLSSGLNYSEAIIQGIYEVVERDGVSTAFAGGKFWDVDLLSISSKQCRDIIDEFERNGVRINIKYVENEFEMPCFIATGNDVVKKSAYFLSGGFGCHSDKEIALLRALTELEQTRKVIFENKREDIERMRPNGECESEYNRILSQHFLWYNYNPERSVSYKDICTLQFIDMKAELEWQLKKLKDFGYHVYVANLTYCSEESKAVPVVRVIIPGLENWYHDKERIGMRLFNKVQAHNLKAMIDK